MKLKDILRESLADSLNIKGALQAIKSTGLPRLQWGKAGQVRGAKLNVATGGVGYTYGTRLPQHLSFTGVTPEEVEKAKAALKAGGWSFRQEGPSPNYIVITGYKPV